MSAATDRWEVAKARTFYEPESVEKLLSEGWEPFSVTLPGNGETIWFKRLADTEGSAQ